MDAYEATKADGATRIKGNGAAHAVASGPAEVTSAMGRGVAKSKKPRAVAITHALDEASDGLQTTRGNKFTTGEAAKSALRANESQRRDNDKRWH